MGGRGVQKPLSKPGEMGLQDQVSFPYLERGDGSLQTQSLS
jgi:hypothetical protein